MTQTNGKIIQSSLHMGKYTISISCFCFIQSNIHLLINNFFFLILYPNFSYENIVVTNRPIEDWNVSEIVDMSWLFADKFGCNPNLAKWDVSNVKYFVSALE
jgi:hypothetical protein